ncbi:Protein CBG14010 [Caenorhabditis briggsae]|uniref:Protein CBG14010 n=1 Tax=Caenorhabditis briggsae TaxID=6238 RepID=A8XJ71_CAEBR|nr:Protein CBG14010 [Caenorhabditis briggsae]CAP32696.2 Protein CBG14010 [Caenorhabditis briggsae]
MKTIGNKKDLPRPTFLYFLYKNETGPMLPAGFHNSFRDPKWNELKSTEDEEWTKMWQILRKEQERQWKAGLMKFEKVMLFI